MLQPAWSVSDRAFPEWVFDGGQQEHVHTAGALGGIVQRNSRVYLAIWSCEVLVYHAVIPLYEVLWYLCGGNYPRLQSEPYCQSVWCCDRSATHAERRCLFCLVEAVWGWLGQRTCLFVH